MSTGGLEPPRVASHAPQTCAYTDSATSTQDIIIIKLSNLFGVFVAEMFCLASHPSQKRYLIVFSAECHVDTEYFI